MRVNGIEKLNFKRKLRPNEEADYMAVLKAGKEKAGNTGKTTLIVPTASLPQAMQIGVGNFLDKDAQKFIDFAKLYWGINEIQSLPDGVFWAKNGGRYLPYSGSTLDFGTHMINPSLLTTKEYANILSQEDIEKVLLNAKSASSEKLLIDYENVLDKNSGMDKILRKAYDELLKSDTDEKKKVLKNLELFTQSNKDWLEPKGIFELLSVKFNTRECEKWPYTYKYLYDVEKISIEQRDFLIKELKTGNLAKEIDFYKFKQFLAEEHFKKAKTELNKKGVKLAGDMLIGFSNDEEWAYPKAFYRGKSGGWNLPVLNYETEEAEIMLRKKVNRFAKFYDGIRADAGWKYISQDVIDKRTKQLITNKQHGEKLLNIIEDEVLKVKGKDFDLFNVMYEFVASLDYFNIFDGTTLKKPAINRMKIITSYDLGPDWGTSKAFEERGWVNGSYILGPTNHDSKPLRVEFADVVTREKQINTLSKILNIPKEKLNNFEAFLQAKFAEPMQNKHNMFFFTEALNLSGQYKDNVDRTIDYRLKIPENYQEHYFKSLEKGLGFNAMDALDKVFIAKGLDKKEPELYKKIVKYKKILQTPEKNNKFSWLFAGITAGALLILTSLLMYKKRAGNSDSKTQ